MIDEAQEASTPKTNVINTYTCPIGHVRVTRKVDEGVTPLKLRCQECGEYGDSGWYHPGIQHLEPTDEWYKPQFPERTMHQGIIDHCRSGGLLLRKVGEPDETLGLLPVEIMPIHRKRPETYNEKATKALTNVKPKRARR